MRKKFKIRGWGHKRYPWSAQTRSYTFDDWNQNSNLDGWVCRNDLDCDWIDEKLGCDSRNFSLDSIQVAHIWIVAFLHYEYQILSSCMIAQKFLSNLYISGQLAMERRTARQMLVQGRLCFWFRQWKLYWRYFIITLIFLYGKRRYVIE